MDKTASEIRFNQWKQIVLEANGSSISKKEWCRQNGISEKQLYYWQRKIRHQEAEKLTNSDSEKVLPVVSQSAGFVELSLSAKSDECCPIPQKNLRDENSSIIIRINDCRILITEGVQEPVLRTVLAAVRNA